MDQIKKYLGIVVGTSVASFGFRIALALFMLYTGAVTNLGDAVGQALDKQRSIAVCADLINETPVPVISEAVEAEKPKE